MLLNERIILKKRPTDLPRPDDFEIRKESVGDLSDSALRIRINYVALSPWQLQRMKDFKNYTTPFEIGELIDCDVLGEIIQIHPSYVGKFKIGQHVVGRLGWQRYADVSPAEIAPIPDLHDPILALTALSSPGLTAYTCLDLYGRNMPGQTMVVTSAAGAVGMYAVQLGKLANMNVIGVCGSDTKCEFVQKTLMANFCLNYNSPSFANDLSAICNNGIHQVFDTTGGPVADIIFEHLAKYARVLVVGRTISNISEDPSIDMVNMRQLWAKEATVHGFSRYSYPERWKFAQKQMKLLCEQKLITSHHQVISGLRNTVDALNGMLSGFHQGKVIVKYFDGEEAI
jgi:NADPH-dependent curcumin reductase CurA